MTRTTLLASALLALPLAAQQYLVPPATAPNVGTCNAYPFNTSDMRYQALITAADLGSTPGLICGLSFAQCATGSVSFASITIKMAHFSGATMSTTFDSNMTSPGPAFTMLDSVSYTWNVTADVWNDIGFQNKFPYNGRDNVVVEVLVKGRSGTSSATRRENTNQRVYQGSYTGQLTGSNGGNTAFKMRVLMGDASTQLFGLGCKGSNGIPAFTFAGSSQLGQTLGLDCTNLPTSGTGILLMGLDSRLPVFPLDLTAAGAPGCILYHDFILTAALPADAQGHTLVKLPIPNDSGLRCLALYFSWVALDPPANSLGLTFSNYGRALLGN